MGVGASSVTLACQLKIPCAWRPGGREMTAVDGGPGGAVLGRPTSGSPVDSHAAPRSEGMLQACCGVRVGGYRGVGQAGQRGGPAAHRGSRPHGGQGPAGQAARRPRASEARIDAGCDGPPAQDQSNLRAPAPRAAHYGEGSDSGLGPRPAVTQAGPAWRLVLASGMPAAYPVQALHAPIDVKAKAKADSHRFSPRSTLIRPRQSAMGFTRINLPKGK